MKTDNEILVDYLDGNLNASEIATLETRLKQDMVLAEEWKYLQAAKEIVVLNEIRNRVSELSGQHRTIEQKHPGAVVRTMFSRTLRVAAALVLITGIAAMYKYLTVNDRTLYNKQFNPYEIQIQRGESPASAVTRAYQEKDWKKTIRNYESETVKSNKSRFLAGMAQMELENFTAAISLFNQNLATDQADFREESEYYLSLAYLMNGQESNAMAIWSKIRSDSTHAYYPVVSRISPIDMKIIELKK